MSLLALLLSAHLDGEAALRHASALASLGPHPWGSPRNRAAAEYVAAQFRAAGLAEVRLEEFESHGVRGANVVGVLRGGGSLPEFVVVGAHHDTAPEAPGAYDDGGGVGVVIEAARVLSQSAARPRTVIFVSWDGEEAWSTGRTTTAGSRAFLKGLGARSRDLTAALAVEMCGWKGGTPSVHPIAYADPLRPGGYVAAPDWLMAAVLSARSRGGERLRVGDPILSWLYQPAVRTFQVGLYGDDLSFLQAGLPAVQVSDSSFTAYYPWYHKPADTPDKIDAAALARIGDLVVEVVEALGRAPRGPAVQPRWIAAFGHVWGAPVVWAIGVVALALSLAAAVRTGVVPLGVRIAQAAAVGFLLWRHPVPTLWVFVPLLILTAFRPRGWPRLVGLLPLLALAGLGAAAWLRGFVRGVWPTPIDLAVAGLALALFWVTPRASSGGAPRRRSRGARGLGGNRSR
jgi:hypothetical protein